MQHIRRAEKQLIFTEFKDRVGDIMSGVVRRFERSDVTIDLGKLRGPPPQPRARSHRGIPDRRAHPLFRQGPSKPASTAGDYPLTRADPQFVIKLFQLEVSEINDGTIEIKGIAREPGFRTKLAVHTRDPQGRSRRRLRRPPRPARQEYRSRAEQREGGHHQVGRQSQGLHRQRPRSRPVESFIVDEVKRRVKIMVAEDQLSPRHRQARPERPPHLQVDGLADRHRAGDCGIDGLRGKGRASRAKPGQDRGHHAPGGQRPWCTPGFLTLDDLLQAELADLEQIPELKETAPTILEAVKAEAQRRHPAPSAPPPPAGEPPAAPRRAVRVMSGEKYLSALLTC